MPPHIKGEDERSIRGYMNTLKRYVSALDSSNIVSDLGETGSAERLGSSKLFDVVNALDFGLAADGEDQAENFNNAVAYCTTNGTPLQLNSGTYVFNSKPDDISGSLILIGAGSGNTILQRNYSEGTGSNGFLHCTSGSMKFSGFTLSSSSGNTGGSGITLLATTQNNTDGSFLSDIEITAESGGSWNTPFRVDGSERSGSNARNIYADNLRCYAATNSVVYLNSVTNCHLSGTFSSVGGTTGLFTVTGSSSGVCNNLRVDATYCEDLSLDYVNQFSFNCSSDMTSITNTANVTNGTVTVSGADSIQSNWSDVGVRSGTSISGSYTNGQLLIGNTTGNTLDAATLTEGEGIDISNGPGSITISCEDASPTNKGIAAFFSGDFSVTAGSVSILDSGIDHNQTTNYVADEHIDWTNATDNFVTTGSMVVGSPTGGSQGAGTINAVTVYDDSIQLTDYVFEDNYQSLSMDAMESYYKEHKHLPTIKGRESWEKEGKFSLGDLTNMLWETVEVQAKYIAELNNRLKKLEEHQ